MIHVHHPLATACSLGAAVALGCSAVLQHSAASAHPHLGPLGLVGRLVRSPRWLAGRACDAGALVLQGVALAHGPLLLVQSILASSLLVALFLTALTGHHHLHAAEWRASAAVAVGLLLLVVVGRPGGGSPPSDGDWLGITLAGAAIGAIAAVGQRRLGPRGRATVLGGLGGALFALDAAFLKAAVDADGALAFLRHWEMLGFLATAALGNVLIARAFQQAPLTASLPALTAAEPVTALVIGAAFFDEHLRRHADARAVEALALLALLGGVILLARSPILAHEDDRPADANEGRETASPAGPA